MIRELSVTDLPEALGLVGRTFRRFVGPLFCEEGRDTYEQSLLEWQSQLPEQLENGRVRMWGDFEEGKLAGVLAVRNKTHIFQFFVDGDYHRRGIATRLFETFCRALPRNAKCITVNASPYATEFYHRLGFHDTGAMQVQAGIRFTPMEYRL